MRVRRAVAEDVPAMMAMERAAETAPHWGEQVYAGLLAGGGRERGVSVAEEAGAMAGFGVVGEVAGVAEVENLVVAGGWRRRGAGRAICEELVRWATERGADVMELEVRAGNEAALALYAAMGFAEVGRRRGYYGDGEDAVLMRLGLASSGE